MKKFLFLFLMCTSLSLVAPVAPAQDYEDIAECILVSVPKHAIFDGDYLYGVTRDGDLEIFDVSDIFTLTTFTTKPALNPAQYISPAGYGGARSGDYLFLTNQGGSVVDVSNPMAPVQVGIFNTLYRCVNLVVAGKYMVGAEYSFNSPNNNAVEVWDISDPLNVVSVSSYISAEEGWSVAVYGDYLYYASDWSVPVLSILDFSDPTNISLLNSISLSEIPYHMKVVGDKLVTSGTSIIRLFDLTDPLNPVQTDAESVSGRVCAEQGSRIINNDTVHKVVGTDLEFVQNFDDHGNYQGDGFPFGSDSQYVGTDGMVALAGQNRILILRTLVPPEPLTVDIKTISEATGGIANFTLDALNTYAGRNYLLMGSVTGTVPGTPLPGGLVLPLNWDIFTNIAIDFVNTPIFDQFMGTLDAAGQATAKFDTLGPIPGTFGIKFFFAFLLASPYDFVSNYVEIEVVQ